MYNWSVDEKAWFAEEKFKDLKEVADFLKEQPEVISFRGFSKRNVRYLHNH